MTGGVISRRLYAVASNSNLGAVYNPGTNSWTSIASPMTPRQFPAGAVAGGKLYLIGGATAASRASRIVEAYTP